MANVTLPKHNLTFGTGEKLFLFTGLNVLEDEGLALEVAQELQKICKAEDVSFVFKASFDKANRSSVHSYRGPGLDQGMKILEKVKGQLNVPIITDIHEADQAFLVGVIADILQIPAFLCRQTDLVVAAAKAAAKAEGLLHVKKGQFLAPWDCANIVQKIKQAAEVDRDLTILCERGTSFGYNNLVVDFIGIPEMQKLGCPVSFDAGHAVQLPGAGKGVAGDATATGGRQFAISTLANAAVASGVDGIFIEFHPDPSKAKCDGPSSLPLAQAGEFINKLKKIHTVVSA